MLVLKEVYLFHSIRYEQPNMMYTVYLALCVCLSVYLGVEANNLCIPGRISITGVHPQSPCHMFLLGFVGPGFVYPRMVLNLLCS